ncbi:hypothetical protein NM688_g8038 [Phlebia brevispora]|uniref:Uncharacterized protein n=1 Tax=Phlebia brevispora TaxID=194682 RepID=A0ACC1RYA6_9APHY|nr:hypothetical protein NM688_g8038 [Phlebia brevispora]
MLSRAAKHAPKPVIPTPNARSAQTFKAFYATIRSLRQGPPPPEVEDGEVSNNVRMKTSLRATSRSQVARAGFYHVHTSCKPFPT